MNEAERERIQTLAGIKYRTPEQREADALATKKARRRENRIKLAYLAKFKTLNAIAPGSQAARDAFTAFKTVCFYGIEAMGHKK